MLYNREDYKCGEMVLSELIAKGARVSSRDSKDRTPLHIAAEKNHLFAAQLLLKNGAKVMPRDKSGRTPLDMAESAEMIKLLKQHGATER
jgi:ankyrin repeat protein